MVKGGGGIQCCGVVFTPKLEVSAILKGEHKNFPPFKRCGGGDEKSFTVLRGGGGRRKFRTRDFPIL